MRIDSISFIRILFTRLFSFIAWIFCVIDRLSVDNLVEEYLAMISKDDGDRGRVVDFECYSRIELGRFKIVFNGEVEWLDFIELTLADWLEQVEGAAETINELYGWNVGEAYSYRRDAYHKMADILAQRRSPRLNIVTKMIQEVRGLFMHIINASS